MGDVPIAKSQSKNWSKLTKKSKLNEMLINIFINKLSQLNKLNKLNKLSQLKFFTQRVLIYASLA